MKICISSICQYSRVLRLILIFYWNYRAVNKVTTYIGTDINRCFDDIINSEPVEVVSDQPSFFKGTYRNIIIEKNILKG